MTLGVKRIDTIDTRNPQFFRKYFFLVLFCILKKEVVDQRECRSKQQVLETKLAIIMTYLKLKKYSNWISYSKSLDYISYNNGETNSDIISTRHIAQWPLTRSRATWLVPHQSACLHLSVGSCDLSEGEELGYFVDLLPHSEEYPMEPLWAQVKYSFQLNSMYINEQN